MTDITNFYKLNNLDYLLSKVPYESNILEYYDNITYNIRFYMLNQTYQIKLSKDRYNGIVGNNSNLPDDSKIIIAETGVTPNYDITSLTLKTLYSSVYQNSSATTFQMEMKITEPNGCSLLNKIVSVSRMLGYENYILQPFHVDVWFSGYEQATQKPVKIIGNQVFTYEVVLGEVKTNVSLSGTQYNFVMIHSPKSAFNKTIQALGNIGLLDIKDGTIGGYKKALQKYINDKFFENNPKFKQYYADYNGEFFTIGKLIDGSVNSYEKNLNNVLNEKINEKNLNTSKTKISTIGGIDIESVHVYKEFSASYSMDDMDGKTRPNTTDTFDTFFQKLCLNTSELKNYTARPVFKVVYVGNYEGQELHKIYADIVFKNNSYLEYFNTVAKSGKTTETFKQKLRNEMSVKELQKLLYSGALNKKYEWMYNGHDTSVLEMNSSLDMLWYANIPYIDSANIQESYSENVKKYDLQNSIEKDKNLYFTQPLLNEKLSTVINRSNKPLDGIRNLAKDKRIYLDDVYHVMDDKSKNEYLNPRKILEIYDEYSDIETSEDTTSDVIAQNAKVGYNNIYQNGNLTELNITILGDPYWIGLSSDNQLYAGNSDNDIINANTFPNFSFIMKTPIGQKEDGTYDLENVVYFSNIYQLVESTSILENGRFVQQLKGVINNAFMYNARLKV